MARGLNSILISLSILLALSSCDEQAKKSIPPKDLLSKEQFTGIMEELFLIEGLRSMHTSAEHKQLNPTESYYNSLWEKSEVSKKKFISSFEYYSKDRSFMEGVYTEIARRIKVKEDKVKSESSEKRPVHQEAEELR